MRWGASCIMMSIIFIYFPLLDGLHGNDFFWPRGFRQILQLISHKWNIFYTKYRMIFYTSYPELLLCTYEKLTRWELVYFKAALQFRHLNWFGWLVKILFHFWFIVHVQSQDPLPLENCSTEWQYNTRDNWYFSSTT